MPSRDLLRRLPKAELHVHLDGSLRPETLIDLARAAGSDLPSRDPETLRRYMRVDDARNLEDYLKRFDITVATLQTPEALERVAWEMTEDAARDGVRYLEVRYCPELSRRGGLKLHEVIEAQLRGFARGERDFGVRAGVINCSLRHYDPAVSVEIARASVVFRGRGVVGFDLAGGEAGRPPGIHREAFEIAFRAGLGITVHAGEAWGAASIREAVEVCHAQRIGHGTRLFEKPALQDEIRSRGVLLEINLTSNLQTRVVARASEHPIRAYFDAGLRTTLCTDNWLISGVSLSGEYDLACRELGFTRPEVDRLILNGFEAAFLQPAERAAMVSRVAEELEATP